MQPVARRTVVAAAGGLAALSALDFSPAVANDTQRSAMNLTHEGRELRRFDHDLSASLPWIAPGVVRLAGSSDDARAVSVRVEWDGRLARATSATAVAVVDDAIHEVPGRLTSRGSTQILVLPLAPLAGFLGSSGSAVIALPVQPTPAVEERGFDRIAATRVTLQDRSGRGLGSAPRTATSMRAVDGRVWAGSLSVLWAGDRGADSEVGDAARSFSRPQVVELRADGPGPVPAGSRVLINADADAVGRLSLADVTGDVPTSTRWDQQGGVQTLTVTLGAALPDGRTVRIEVATDGTPRASTAAARAACSVTLVGAGPAELQRITGDESRVLGV